MTAPFVEDLPTPENERRFSSRILKDTSALRLRNISFDWVTKDEIRCSSYINIWTDGNFTLADATASKNLSIPRGSKTLCVNTVEHRRTEKLQYFTVNLNVSQTGRREPRSRWKYMQDVNDICWHPQTQNLGSFPIPWESRSGRRSYDRKTGRRYFRTWQNIS